MGDFMIIALIILSIFSLFGVFYIIQCINKVMYRQKQTCCKPILLWQISNNNQCDLEMDLLCALSSLRWYNMQDYHKIFFINCGLNENDLKLCRNIFSQYDYDIIDNLKIDSLLMEK